MKLLSVNIGQPRLNPWKEVKLTGIDKRPVDGPVMVTPARAKVQGWLARAGWIKRFTLAARPGSYFRVIEPGEIRAGDPIEIVRRPEHDVTVALSFRALTVEPELLPRLLAADALPREIRELARRRTA